jgi:uncharacterized protein (DUF433 family)
LVFHAENYVIAAYPNLCGGKPVIKGTFGTLVKGYSIESIHTQYPTVSKKQIGKVIQLLKEE